MLTTYDEERDKLTTRMYDEEKEKMKSFLPPESPCDFNDRAKSTNFNTIIT